MSDQRAPEVPVNHVVHLVPELAADSPAPPALGYPAPRSPRQRAALVLVLVAATVLGAVPLVLLWTPGSPGLWFQLLFTVFIGGVIVALWYGAAGARATGKERAAAVREWATMRDQASATPARIVARQVALTDSGGVSGFDVTVERVDGEQVLAAWTPHPERSDRLLQPQVPGIGAPVRIWSVPSHPGSPVVVEVVDPTRVPDPGRDD